jgi:hypothetical protein
VKVKAAGGLLGRFMGHVVPGVIRPLRILWNQLIGFLFLLLAAGATPSAVHNAKQFQGDFESSLRVALTFIFVGLMLYFGITSLLRARRITRS